MSASPHWLVALQKTLAENEKVRLFQLATFDADHVPHVRTQANRSILVPKSHPGLPLLLSSTDIRTPKVTELISNPSNPESLAELCWWIEPAQEQFRIRARTFIIPSPSNPFYEKFIPEKGKGMSAIINEDKVDWEKDRKGIFERLTGPMKAGFCRPAPPGSVLEAGYEKSKEWPQTLPDFAEAKSEEDKKNLDMALGNFALMVYEPEVVDYVELGVVPNRRRRYTRKGEDWVEEVTVP